MDCCTYTEGANQQFGEARAGKDAQEYAKQGLNSHSRAMLELVSERGAKDITLLEIGSGIGAVTLELLKRGAAKAINIEASSAYFDAARSLAKQAGFGDQITYQRADFAAEAGQVSAADVVIMHRVVCCYPDMNALVSAAAQHSLRPLAISYPVDSWYMRLATNAENFFRRVKGSTFRMYIHSPHAIFETASAHGLKPIRETSSGVWRLVLFERNSPQGLVE